MAYGAFLVNCVLPAWYTGSSRTPVRRQRDITHAAVYSSVGAFSGAVEQIVRLRQEGRAWLLVGSGGVSFTFAPGAASDEVLDVTEEVAEAIQAAVLDRDAEHFARRRSNPVRRLVGDEEEPEDVAAASQKLDLVKNTFDIHDINRRRWLKTTSKISTPSLVEWDVLVKYSDDTIPPPDDAPAPAGILRFETHQPGPARSPQHEDVVMTVDVEDVRYFRSRLDELLNRLEAIETA